MPKFCLRVDLNYVPWDEAEAELFGHGEPAMALKLLAFARSEGFKFHFFTSTRSLSAFPTIHDAVLNDGHRLDWRYDPDESSNWPMAQSQFLQLGHRPKGIGFIAAKPEVAFPENFLYASIVSQSKKVDYVAKDEPPANLIQFAVEAPSLLEAMSQGISIKSWAEKSLQKTLQSEQTTTEILSPQVLARFDPDLAYIRNFYRQLQKEHCQFVTLDDLLKNANT